MHQRGQKKKKVRWFIIRSREMKSWMSHFSGLRKKEVTRGSACKVLHEDTQKRVKKQNKTEHLSPVALFPSAYIAPTCSSKSKSLQYLVKDTLVALAWPAQNHVTCWRSFNLFLASLCDFGAALVTLKIDFLLPMDLDLCSFLFKQEWI